MIPTDDLEDSRSGQITLSLLHSHSRSLESLHSARSNQIKNSEASSTPSAMAPKPITSPVPVTWYPTLAVVMLSIGLIFTASFFIYEATSTRRSRSLPKEITTGAVASVFLGFGSLFLLLASGVYV